MKFGQWLFVSMCLCALLGAVQAKMATDILKEQTEIKMMPMRAAPAKRTATYWEPPSERLNDNFRQRMALRYSRPFVWPAATAPACSSGWGIND